MRTSPKNTPCLHCGKMLTARGCAEHERHHCPKNPNRRKRTFGKSTCIHCGKRVHSNGLRAHIATQHPAEFAKMKPKKKLSKAAQRRALAAKKSKSPQGSHKGGEKSPEPQWKREMQQKMSQSASK